MNLREREAAMHEMATKINAGRKPKFGDLMRGLWASETNPQRDGFFVKEVRNGGRINPGDRCCLVVSCSEQNLVKGCQASLSRAKCSRKMAHHIIKAVERSAECADPAGAGADLSRRQRLLPGDGPCPALPVVKKFSPGACFRDIKKPKEHYRITALQAFEIKYPAGLQSVSSKVL